MESSAIDKPILSVAIRVSDLSIEDLEAISAINRIALNSDYMVDILKD